MIDQTQGRTPPMPEVERRGLAPDLPLEGRHDPPDLRLRGRLAGARHEHDRARRRRARPDRSAASPLAIPILASAMDAVVDARFAGALARLGGLAVLNLEGVQARYDDPDAVLERIAAAPDDEVQDLLAEAYAEPIREDLVARRLEEIHAAGSKAAVAATPGAARRFGPFCAEHGADLFLVQSQVSSARHLATDYDPLSLAEFTRLHADPGRGRQHDERRGRLRPHGAGRRGRLRRRRARAPPARPARCSASASRR